MAEHKVDVILPVYNSIHWVEKSLSSLYQLGNFEFIHQIFVMNDGSTDANSLWLEDLCRGRPKITLIHNEENMGYTKTVNRAMKLSTADFLLILNSDCVLTPYTVEKLVYHAGKNPNIGLVSPISNNSPVVSLPFNEGENALIVNNRLAKEFARKSVKACTIVGNCLLITRACYQILGDFSLEFGSGYGEETDYQFRAHEHGFEALIALDSYVYHRGAVSFGSDPMIENQRLYNHELFMKMWGEKYKARWEEYLKDEPIAKVQYELPKQKSFEYDVLFILPGFSPASGGIRVVAKIINELISNGISANVNCLQKTKFDWSREILLFDPLYYAFDELNDSVQLKARHIIATSWDTYPFAKVLAHRNKAVLHYFVQGWEPYFDNGNQYNDVIDGYRSAENIITISSWLKNKLLEVGAKNVTLCRMGIDSNFLYQKSKPIEERTFDALFVLRGQYIKADWIQRDLITRLIADGKYKLQVVISDPNVHMDFIPSERLTLHSGPYSFKDLQNWLMETKIYIDTSMHEGFGLLPLEAMAFGCIVIASNSKGCLEYLRNEENGFLIEKANNPDVYLEKFYEIMAASSDLKNQIVKSAMEHAPAYSEKKFLEDFLKYCQSSLEDLKLKPCHLEMKELDHLMKFIPLKRGFMKLYLDYGQGFSEKTSKTAVFIFETNFTKIFELDAEKVLQDLRLDPFEHGGIFLNDDASITFHEVGGESFQVKLIDVAGPYYHKDGKLVFLMDDPGVLIPVKKKIQSIEVRFFCARADMAVKDEVFHELITIAKRPPPPLPPPLPPPAPPKAEIAPPKSLRQYAKRIVNRIRYS